MKIRSGFVSNSSSSSFLVAFTKVPESAEELRTMLFGDANNIPDLYNTGEVYGTVGIAEDLFRDMERQEPLTVGEIFEHLMNRGSLDGSPDYPHTYRMSETQREAAERQYKEALDAHSENVAKTFASANRGKYVFLFTFSDNDGSREATLEHGDTFGNLPHIRISQH